MAIKKTGLIGTGTTIVVAVGAPLDGYSTTGDVAGCTGRFGSPAAATVGAVQAPIKAGVYGIGINGVQGESNAPGNSGVWGNHSGGGYGLAGTSDQPGGIGVLGRGMQLAARFEGDVEVTGDIRLLNADIAEDFSVRADLGVEPGTVLVIGDDGSLAPCSQACDPRAAGIVSGAGSFRPALVLDHRDAAPQEHRVPLAMIGKVGCKVDAAYGAVRCGDLLTTSPTTGHAMRVADAAQAAGAVVGKALAAWSGGRGVIPVLVMLR
jgi:hypothetical protein